MKKFLSAILSLVCVFSMSAVNVSAEENNVLYGDANCDSRVDICDITALNQHIIGNHELSEQGIKNCGFFNNDVTIKTLMQMKKYAIKTVDKLEFSYHDDGIYDEYEPFDYADFDKVKDYFPNIITVAIKHQYSNFEREWTAEDFKLNNSQISSIYDITYGLKDCVEKLPDGWVQILIIYLPEEDSSKLQEIVAYLDDKALNGECPQIHKIGLESSQEPIED